jgi:hypothetical protein
MTSHCVYEWNDDERNVLDYLPNSSYCSDDTYKPVFTILKEMYEEDAQRLYNIHQRVEQLATIYDYWLDYDGEDDEVWDSDEVESVVSIASYDKQGGGFSDYESD